MRHAGLWRAAIGGIVFLWGAAGVAYTKAPPGAGVQIGEPAQDFAVEGLSGQTLVLSHYRGRPLVIHFFASWLGWSCWQEMSHLNKAAEKHQDRGLVVIAIGVLDSPGKIEEMARRLGLTFPIGLDPNSQLTLHQYRIRIIPTTVFVDREGVIQEIWTGPIDWSSLLGLIAEIL